ncbi:hypothetical protein Dimus_010040, partial [Dionaea muscipula]
PSPRRGAARGNHRHPSSTFAQPRSSPPTSPIFAHTTRRGGADHRLLAKNYTTTTPPATHTITTEREPYASQLHAIIITVNPLHHQPTPNQSFSTISREDHLLCPHCPPQPPPVSHQDHRLPAGHPSPSHRQPSRTTHHHSTLPTHYRLHPPPAATLLLHHKARTGHRGGTPPQIKNHTTSPCHQCHHCPPSSPTPTPRKRLSVSACIADADH